MSKNGESSGFVNGLSVGLMAGFGLAFLLTTKKGKQMVSQLQAVAQEAYQNSQFEQEKLSTKISNSEVKSLDKATHLVKTEPTFRDLLNSIKESLQSDWQELIEAAQKEKLPKKVKKNVKKIHSKTSKKIDDKISVFA